MYNFGLKMYVYVLADASLGDAAVLQLTRYVA